MVSALTQVVSIAATDLVLIQGGANGIYETAAVSAFQTYMQSNLVLSTKVTQFSSPSATGFSVSISSAAYSTWLILTPLATYATGTIVLPVGASDKTEVTVNCTQIVTTLTTSFASGTVVGAPTTLAVNGFYTMKYNASTTTWYRVG